MELLGTEKKTADLDLLGTKETADLLHVSLATLRTWLQNDDAPLSARIGKRRYFRRGDVVAWANAKFDSVGSGRPPDGGPTGVSYPDPRPETALSNGMST